MTWLIRCYISKLIHPIICKGKSESHHYKVVKKELEGSSACLWREHWREMASLPPSPSPPWKSPFRYWGGLLNIESYILVQHCEIQGCEGTDSKGHIYAGSGDWSAPIRSEFVSKLQNSTFYIMEPVFQVDLYGKKKAKVSLSTLNRLSSRKVTSSIW